jgi:hypothetical protein
MYKDYSYWYTMFCGASPSMYWCPDRSELQNLFGKTVHPQYVMPSVQGIFVYGLILSWRINNSHTNVVGQTQQRQAFRLLGISIYWLEFTVVSLGKKFIRMKPFSSQTYCIIMVQKSVAVTFLVS